MKRHKSVLPRTKASTGSGVSRKTVGAVFSACDPRRIWAISALGTSLLYFVWPLLHGFVAYLVMMVVLEVVSSHVNQQHRLGVGFRGFRDA